jgi:hypothetical protein
MALALADATREDSAKLCRTAAELAEALEAAADAEAETESAAPWRGRSSGWIAGAGAPLPSYLTLIR